MVVLGLIAAVAGLVLGFAGARLARRPAGTAGAASMARSVGGAVGTRRDLDLGRLQRSVFSEMMRHVATRGGRTIVPATFRIRMHPSDHATVSQAPGWFTSGLEQAMAAAGRDHGWNVPDRLSIELVADPSRRPGVPAVDASGEGATPSGRGRAPSAARTAPARLEQRDSPTVTYDLVADDVTIGRGADRTIRVEDSRASRQHATVRREGGRWAVTDEGSSNGTQVNGRALAAATPVVLADGDVIAVGPVSFVFRESVPDAEDGTRPLDAARRRSISQEYFPAGRDSPP